MSRLAGWVIRSTALLVLLNSSLANATEGTLFIIGGGLRPDNSAVFQRLLAAGGGAKNCRIAVFCTASMSTASSEQFRGILERYEVQANKIALLDIRPDNANTTAHDPNVVELLGKCTIAYFVGGDQQRITRALLRSDGSDTPVLAAVRKLLDRGGVVAGTSAGAAMQSRVMITAGGLPDDALDEGMDPLDFGVSRTPERRGLTVSQGLGFFPSGIVDSHFSQLRGRLGRLARVLVAEKIDCGFGIDENTALVVCAHALLEVVGAGCVTVVNAKKASCSDGPLGCTLEGLSVSCLQAGDRWDASMGAARVATGKQPVESSHRSNRGNFLIPDIAGEGAIRHALFMGLADNTSNRQQGITLRFSESFGHGYRYTFRKTEQSRCWAGLVADWDSLAVQDIDLTIEPVLSSLRPPSTALPVDLPPGRAGTACQALWFRGVLAANSERRLRPDAPLTRAEFAVALAQSIYLPPPPGDPRAVADVSAKAWGHDEICRVIEAKLLNLDDLGRFRPDDVISRQDAAVVLLELYRRNGGTVKPILGVAFSDELDTTASRREAVQESHQLGLLQAAKERFRPRDSLTRGEAAIAFYRSLELPW